MIELSNDDARVRIDPERGGRIASMRVHGLEILVSREEDSLRWGCYPMAPFAGRLRRGCFAFAGRSYSVPLGMPPHAIHGTVFERAWQIDGDAEISIDLGAAWPFPGRAIQHFRLHANSLSCVLEVQARSGPFPASLGWHPWFRRELERGAPAELHFDAPRMYERDAEGIPSGRLVDTPPGPWDDCFPAVRDDPRLTWAGSLELQLSSNAGHWVVFDQPQHAICVEPQTGPPDALNIAPRIVEPGRPLTAAFEISWCAPT